MKMVANIIQDTPGKKGGSLSAMSGTTNTLEELSKYIAEYAFPEATELVDTLEKNYRKVVYDSL